MPMSVNQGKPVWESSWKEAETNLETEPKAAKRRGESLSIAMRVEVQYMGKNRLHRSPESLIMKYIINGAPATVKTFDSLPPRTVDSEG